MVKLAKKVIFIKEQTYILYQYNIKCNTTNLQLTSFSNTIIIIMWSGYKYVLKKKNLSL